MSKIRQSARGDTCTFQIPGVCNNDPETVVLCHAPHPDKGMGHKSPDTWAAYGCSDCHAEIDGRGGSWFYRNDTGMLGAAMEKRLFWFDAICETQRRLIAKGLMPK